MTTPAVKTLTELQDQVLAMVKQGEERVLQAVKPVAEVVRSLIPEVPHLPFADQVPTAAEIVEASFGLLEKLVAHERQFAEHLLEAMKMEEAKQDKATPMAKPGAVSLKAEAAPEVKAS